MKKIITSLSLIAAVGALVVGATGAFFSDTETAVDNTYTAGTIDIAVDGENPWEYSWANYLDKPSQTNYMNFVIKNEGENPARIWKRLTNVVNGPGAIEYCEASSEPEWFDGGGTGNESDCTGNYVERDNLSAFMIYDMSICLKTDTDDCLFEDDGYGNTVKPVGGDWVVLIDEANQVRVDNVVDTWVELTKEIGDLDIGEELVVSQSYHLMTWDDSGQPMVTNWAQGDTMTFDIELEARQIDAPAPGTFSDNGDVMATAYLTQKNTTTWDPIENGATGELTYVVAKDTFDYEFSATGLEDKNYSLVYYPDPWSNPKTVVVIASGLTASGGGIDTSGNLDLSTDMPKSTDANYPAGAKVWLVPDTSLSGDQLAWTDTDEFLFDLTYVNYDDTNQP